VRALKVFTLFVFIYGFLFFPLPLVYAGDGDTHDVLISAESLFKALKAKNYTEVWKFLTAKSKSAIVDDVYREAVKRGGKYSKEQMNDDFTKGGSTAGAYWDSYLAVFDPDTVLEHSTWKINVVKIEYAEINILYKKSEKPAVLKLYKEDGMWKVGLEETFRTRKWLDNLGL
jgi:hypothetical protein